MPVEQVGGAASPATGVAGESCSRHCSVRGGWRGCQFADREDRPDADVSPAAHRTVGYDGGTEPEVHREHGGEALASRLSSHELDEEPFAPDRIYLP